MSMNQRQATVKAIVDTLEARGTEYELNGSTPISEVLTSEDKATVRKTLFTMFRDGDANFKDEATASKYEADAELNKYVSGLLNNWIRKAKEFNCGQGYVAKNPGSRAHASDVQMRELKKLLVQYSATNDEEAVTEIKAAIELRKSEIKPKSVAKPINVDALPEALRHLVPSN